MSSFYDDHVSMDWVMYVTVQGCYNTHMETNGIWIVMNEFLFIKPNCY